MRLPENKSDLTDYIADKFQHDLSPEDNNELNIECTVIGMSSVLLGRVKFQKCDTYGKIIEK